MRTERRKIERYDLVLPCFLGIFEISLKNEVMELKTRNISAEGALLSGSPLLPIETPVKLDIIIPAHLIKNEGQKGSFISTEGRVVRSERDGLAVWFHQDYKVLPLSDALRRIKIKSQWIERHSLHIVKRPGDNILHLEKRLMAK